MNSDSVGTIALPIVTVQPDLEDIINEVRIGNVTQENFWVSCYRHQPGESTSSTSVHGKVSVWAASSSTVCDGGVELESQDGVQVDIRKAQAINGVGSIHGRSKEKYTYTVSCPPLNIHETPVWTPRSSFLDPERPEGPAPSSSRKPPRQINALAVSPDGRQFATGFPDGSILLQPVSSSASTSRTNGSSINGSSESRIPSHFPIVRYKPHFSSVTSLRFFPSSKVLLSSGADFALNILDADTARGDRPRTDAVRKLMGHRRMISGVGIVGRGKNVVSASWDGTVRVWDVSSRGSSASSIGDIASASGQIRMMGSKGWSPIHAMCCGVKPINFSFASNSVDSISEVEADVDDREVATEDKVVFCALADGAFEVFDLRTKESVFHTYTSSGATTAPRTPSAPLSAISYTRSSSNASGLLATGSSKGLVSVYDIRALDAQKPLVRFTRNTASITSLVFMRQDGIWAAKETQAVRGELVLGVATEDGLPYIASLSSSDSDSTAWTAGVLAELGAAGDCDATRVIRWDGEYHEEGLYDVPGGSLPTSHVNEDNSRGGVWITGDDGVVRMY